MSKYLKVLIISITILFSCTNNDCNIEAIEVHQISFGIETPISLGNDLVIDAPYYITEDAILNDIKSRITSLKYSNDKYSNNTYMRCVISCENDVSYVLLYDRTQISIDGNSYKTDSILIDLLLDSAAIYQNKS